jgi:cytochrome oxidase Cu insertion factor (SCO1/SenC/PrrC family)
MPLLKNSVGRPLCRVLFVSALLWPSAGMVLAHGMDKHGHDDTRPELSFGRTEDYDYDPPEPGSYDLPTIMAAGDGRVLDPGGGTRRLRDIMEGHITVLAFIYTRCMDPDGCPMSMSLLYDIEYVREQDPAIGDNIRIIAMSFDPEHDTPEVMAKYGYGDKGWARDRQDILYLTTASREDLSPILKAYDQAIGRKQNPDDSRNDSQNNSKGGPLTHQLRVYLIDRKGRVRNIYSLGFMDPRLVITDIRTLLLEEQQSGP